jgi:EmrB/QacA subfamily drug resistance transporter
MSVVGVPMLLGPILGSVLGGLIVASASWRWIFYVNVPIVAVALVLAARHLDRDAGRADAGALDWRGLVLLSPGLFGLVFGLTETQRQGGFGDPIAYGPIVAGCALIASFVAHSLRARRPLIDVRLFRERCFAAAAMTTLLLGASLFGGMLVIALYYQLARGASPLGAGLLLAPQAVGAAIAMPIAGKLTDRSGGGRVALVGTAVACLGTIPLVLVGASTSYSLLAVFLIIRGLGLGSAMMPAMAAAYATLQRDAIPRATSALNVIQRVGGSIGTVVLALVLQDGLTRATAQVASPARQSGAATADRVASAFAHTFWWALALSLLASIPAAVLAGAQRERPAPIGAVIAGKPT